MASTKPKYREVADPQISANQLAQYLVAGPSARKRIVQAAKYQSSAVVTRYRLARDSIVTCLADDARSPATVAKERAKLLEKRQKAGNTPWTNDDLDSSILALDKYESQANKTDIGKVRCAPLQGKVPPLDIAGLRVKVTPDVIVRKGTGASERVGALLAMIAKGEKSSNVRASQGRTAAVLLWLFAQKHLAKYGEIDRKLCMSFDVFEGKVFVPSANLQTLVKNIEDACEEIVSKWPSVPPPDDFDG